MCACLVRVQLLALVVREAAHARLIAAVPVPPCAHLKAAHARGAARAQVLPKWRDLELTPGIDVEGTATSNLPARPTSVARQTTRNRLERVGRVINLR